MTVDPHWSAWKWILLSCHSTQPIFYSTLLYIIHNIYDITCYIILVSWPAQLTWHGCFVSNYSRDVIGSEVSTHPGKIWSHTSLWNSYLGVTTTFIIAVIYVTPCQLQPPRTNSGPIVREQSSLVGDIEFISVISLYLSYLTVFNHLCSLIATSTTCIMLSSWLLSVGIQTQ